jgi:hypothetical protein
VIQLELQYLTDDYPFLSTLIHELGHAFGLDHADCHGYDMDTNGSMIASNTRLWSNGFNLSVPPPVFNPEEYLMLAQNKLAFPNFNFIPALHKSKGQVLENRGQLCLFRNERDDWEVPGYARHGFRALLGRQAGQWSRGRVLLAARGERRLRLEYVEVTMFAAPHETAHGTARTLGDVRLESAKCAKADMISRYHQSRFYEYTPFCNGPGDVKSPRVMSRRRAHASVRGRRRGRHTMLSEGTVSLSRYAWFVG